MMQRKLVQIAVAVGVILVIATPLSVAAQTLASIKVEGNENVSADRILITFGLRIGEELAIEDVREGIRRLYDLGRFSDIQVYAEGEDESGLSVVVAVEERPRVSAVELKGNDRLDDSDLEPALRLERGDPFIAAALEDMRVAVLEIYKDKGFPYATVEARTEEVAGNAVRVTLNIEENTRVTVRKIRFEGNEAFEAADLKKTMETKEDRWWRTDAFFDADVVEEDLRRITELYRKDGYIDAQAAGYSTEYDDEGENVTLTMTIEEGSLYEVSGIEWVGASDFAVDALYDLTLVEPGETYRPSETEQTIGDAYNWYRERGYIYASVRRVEDLEEDGAVRVTFSVDEGEPARIGQIHIVGNERTKEKVIRRELTIEPGDLYRTSEIMASLHRIGNLGFFTDPWVDFAESGDPQRVDLVFSVKERQTGRAGVGVSHTSERGITGFLEITEGNLFGNGQYLDLKWEFGKRSTEVVLGFTEPWFMGRRLSVGFDVYDTDDKRTYGGLSEDFYSRAFEGSPDSDSVVGCGSCDRDYVVERERRGGDVRVGWPFFGSRYTKIYTKYTLEQFRLKEYARVQTVVDTTTMETETDDYSAIDEGWEWRSGVTLTLARRTTDRRFHPRLGSYSRLTAELFGGAFRGDVEYQRYILDARKFVPAVWGTTLMLRGRTGLVTGYGDPHTVPDDTRFELGGVGANGIRGYGNRSILPEGKDLYGGRTMLLGTVELKLPLTSESAAVPIYGLAFLDAGNTWDSRDDTHPTDLYWGTGAGIRVEVPVLGNLGIDLGYGLDDEEGGEWVVHYQFGLEY